MASLQSESKAETANQKKSQPRNAPGTLQCNPTSSTFLSKPRLVGMLEEYLERELKLLGRIGASPGPARLQAHREVLEHLIGEFHSFKPLLSSIKQEYDTYISHLEGQVEQIDPLKIKIQLLIEENNQNILSLQSEERQDIQNLETENDNLKATINELRGCVSNLECQVAKLQTDLSTQYILYRNEADAKKIVISDLNQLKKSQQQPDDQIVQKEDPIVLRIALKQTREDLKLSQRKLAQIIADYGDVVPRKEFDDLSCQFGTQTESLEELKQDFMTLNMELDMLNESYKQTLSDKSAVAEDLEKLKGNATPRPQWNRCSRFFDDGKWAERTENSSSAEKVDFLLAEISGLSIEEIRAGDLFEALGTDEGIPKFLRCEGEIKNVHMNKQEAYKILSGFWPYRVQQLVNNENVAFDMSLFTYLSESQSEERVYEVAYNIHNALSQYEFQLLPGLLMDILLGKREEEIYFELLARHDILKSHLSNLTSSEDASGLITEPELIECLVTNFPVITEDIAVKLSNGVIGADGISPDDIVIQLGEGASVFIERFYESFLEQRDNLLKEFANRVENIEIISVDDFLSILKSLDPSQPEKKMAQLLRHIFRISDKSIDSISGTQTESVSLVLARFKQSAIMRN